MEEGECGPNDVCQEELTPEEVVTGILQGMYDAIFDPDRTEPIQLTLPDGSLLIVMPLGSEPYAPRSGALKNLGDELVAAGLLLDIAELVLIADLFPGDEDFVGGLDFGITALADWASGSTFFLEPVHPSLGPGVLMGQDSLWTGMVDTVLPAASRAVGAGLAGPAGYGGGLIVDAGTTGASVLYDSGRILGLVPNFVKAGVTYSEDTGVVPVVILYPGELPH